MLAKIEKGRLIYPPQSIQLDGSKVINPTKEMLEGIGYYAVVFSERPAVAENQKITEIYTEIENTINVSYAVSLIPDIELSEMRRSAYISETDSIFQLAQMENTRCEDVAYTTLMNEWADKCAQIKERFPYSTI